MNRFISLNNSLLKYYFYSNTFYSISKSIPNRLLLSMQISFWMKILNMDVELMLASWVMKCLEENKKCQREPRTPKFSPELQTFSSIGIFNLSICTEALKLCKDFFFHFQFFFLIQEN